MHFILFLSTTSLMLKPSLTSTIPSPLLISTNNPAHLSILSPPLANHTSILSHDAERWPLPDHNTRISDSGPFEDQLSFRVEAYGRTFTTAQRTVLIEHFSNILWLQLYSKIDDETPDIGVETFTSGPVVLHFVYLEAGVVRYIDWFLLVGLIDDFTNADYPRNIDTAVVGRTNSVGYLTHAGQFKLELHL